MPKINYNKNQPQQQQFNIELPNPMTNHGSVVGMCRALQQGMTGFVKYNVTSSETKDSKTSITLTGQAAKDMFDIISNNLSFEIQNSIMTVKKMFEILDIKTAYFSETGKFSTMITVIGDKKVELKKKITDFIKKYLFECPPIMTKIILEKNPNIKPTNVIGCGGNTIVYFEDDAGYDQFHQIFQMIPDFIQFIPYDGKAHHKDVILRICNEQNPNHKACHSVNPNKNGGTITLLAIENVEDIKTNIQAEIAKLDTSASTDLIDSLLADDDVIIES
jgi:hypothetical protein